MEHHDKINLRFLRKTNNKIRVQVKLITKASENKIGKFYSEKTNFFLKAYVTSPPEKGKANDALIKLISKSLNIPKNKIIISSGKTSQLKLIDIILSE